MTSTEDGAVVVTDIPSTAPREPALQTGTVVAFGTLAINGFALFVAPITPDQKLYLIALITFLGPILAGAIIRFKVFAPRTVDQIRLYYEVALREKEHRLAAARAAAQSNAVVARAIEESLPTMLAKMSQVPGPASQERPRPASRPRPTPDSPGPVSTPPRPSQAQVLPHPGYPTVTAQPEGSYHYTPAEIRSEDLPTGYSRHRLAGE